MPLALPRFYAIIDCSLRAELGLEEIARMLTGAGVRLIQVRAKAAATGEMLADTRRLLSLLPSNSLLIVNDRADVARLAGAAGVHLGQDDLPASAARALLGPDKLIGWSTHNAAQVEAANQLPVDYVAFGPVFATATKADTEPVVGLEGLRAARALTPKPLVAIGGITPANAAAAIEAGADSVAVIAGWLGVADIGGALAAFGRTLGGLG